MARRFALVNPNTDAAVTQLMLRLAHAAAPLDDVVDGITAPFGSPLIIDERALAVAGEAVLALAPQLADFDGILVGAFGDPGVSALREILRAPIVGIGEAALRRAARQGRRFCVATTTPDLAASIDGRVRALGLERNYAGVVLTRGDVLAVSGTPALLDAELSAAIERAIDTHAVEAVVIGGGPLADAAARLAGGFPVELVEPISAGIRALTAAVTAASASNIKAI